MTRLDFSAVVPLLNVRWDVREIAVFEAELEGALTPIFAALDADGTPLTDEDKEGLYEDARAYYVKQPKQPKGKWSGLDVVVDEAIPAGYAELRDKDGKVVVTLRLDGRHLAVAPSEGDAR